MLTDWPAVIDSWVLQVLLTETLRAPVEIMGAGARGLDFYLAEPITQYAAVTYEWGALAAAAADPACSGFGPVRDAQGPIWGASRGECQHVIPEIWMSGQGDAPVRYIRDERSVSNYGAMGIQGAACGRRLRLQRSRRTRCPPPCAPPTAQGASCG